MDSLPLLRGRDFVSALERLGFRVAARNGGLATLRRRCNAVVVPENVVLASALLAAMLRQIGVEPTELLSAIS